MGVCLTLSPRLPNFFTEVISNQDASNNKTGSVDMGLSLLHDPVSFTGIKGVSIILVSKLYVCRKSNF